MKLGNRIFKALVSTGMLSLALNAAPALASPCSPRGAGTR
jgi:hypothetical protein